MLEEEKGSVVGGTSSSAQYRIGIVGAGWRTLSYLRVARAVPEQFELIGVVTRTSRRAEEVSTQWGVVGQSTIDDLLQVARPDFIVLAVPRAVTVSWLKELGAAGLPVLCETPPAANLGELQHVAELVAKGSRVQVAEQYQYQPLHAARLAVTDSNVIGKVSMVYLSVAHDYHAFSLTRRYLRVVDEPALLQARRLRSTVQSGFDTSGPRRAASAIEEVRTVGIVDFEDRLGLYDFAEEQYFSYIRPPRVCIRGSRGEIADHSVRCLANLHEPVTMELRREQTGEDGDLGGNSLRGISMGDRWVYRNPFAGRGSRMMRLLSRRAWSSWAVTPKVGQHFTVWRMLHRTSIFRCACTRPQPLERPCGQPPRLGAAPCLTLRA